MSQSQLLWVYDLSNLDFLTFWPCTNATPEENINRLTVLFLYLSILFAIAFKSFIPLYTGILCMAVLVIVYYLFYQENFQNTEHMQNINMNLQYNPYTIERAALEADGYRDPVNDRVPTPNNPFMNVPIPDYDHTQTYGNYNRYLTNPKTHNAMKTRDEIESSFEKVPISHAKTAMNGPGLDLFHQKLFQDPNGRLWDRHNSQREYISQPNGSVPNKQNEFAQWLYGVNTNCKAGSIWDRYGVKYTDDSLECVPGRNISVPTNFGRKE